MQKISGDGSDLPQSEPRFLAVGRIVRAHGVRGEISMMVLTEFPERFESTERIFIGNELEATPYLIEGYRWHKKNLLLKLEGITNRTQAEQLRNELVQVPLEEAVPLPEGSFYLYQLIGLPVTITTGQPLGQIVNILETGANDVYVVSDGDKEILLPAIPDVVKWVDLEQGVVVELIDGLI